MSTRQHMDIAHFVHNDEDQAGRRISLYGTILEKPAVLVFERAPFSTSFPFLSLLPETLQNVTNLGTNDIYKWYTARSGHGTALPQNYADLKINLFYPSTEQHVKKYSKQSLRVVTETAQIYHESVRPYVQSQRRPERLEWMRNIIHGRAEVDDVIFRHPTEAQGLGKGFVLLPDLNWDRKTMENLHLLALVEGDDIWSLRDLKKKHIGWLKYFREKVAEVTVARYPQLEEDQLKLYVHYQPTYYHFHVHIVHVALESGATQATGKAVGFESIISQLESMSGNDEVGMEGVTLTYVIGETTDLWNNVFEPLKRSKS